MEDAVSMFHTEPWFMKIRIDNCYFTVNLKDYALSARIIFKPESSEWGLININLLSKNKFRDLLFYHL
jgi:hypothetical protein